MTHEACDCPHCKADLLMTGGDFSSREQDYIHQLVGLNMQICDAFAFPEEEGLDMTSDVVDDLMDKIFAVPPNSMN